jgi:hypothetical protein
VVVSGLAGHLALDDLTATPVPANDPSVGSRTTTYQAENGALTGTAHVDTSDSQAQGRVVTGVSDGSATR